MDSIVTEYPRASSILISPEFQSDILTPYMEHTTYLRKSQITLATATELKKNNPDYIAKALGEFSIPESCYIDDTGHFNSVEFNICYNQLSYVMFAHVLKSNFFNTLFEDWDSKGFSYETYRKNQLSSMLIIKIEGKFLSAIASDQFWGELILTKISFRLGITYFYTDIIYYDAHNGKSKGSVVLAYNPNFDHEKKQ